MGVQVGDTPVGLELRCRAKAFASSCVRRGHDHYAHALRRQKLLIIACGGQEVREFGSVSISWLTAIVLQVVSRFENAIADNVHFHGVPECRRPQPWPGVDVVIYLGATRGRFL